jgi:hypothetical protein
VRPRHYIESALREFRQRIEQGTGISVFAAVATR